MVPLPLLASHCSCGNLRKSQRGRGGSSRHRINAFTMLLQCQPGNDIPVISHSVSDVLPLLRLALKITLFIATLTHPPSSPVFCIFPPCSAISCLLFPVLFLSFIPAIRSMPCHKIDCNYCVAVRRMD